MGFMDELLNIGQVVQWINDPGAAYLGRKKDKKTEAERDAAVAQVAAIKPPPVETKPVMPIADDEEVQKRKRRSVAAQRSRQGRASTFMTTDDPLGGA